MAINKSSRFDALFEHQAYSPRFRERVANLQLAYTLYGVRSELKSSPYGYQSVFLGDWKKVVEEIIKIENLPDYAYYDWSKNTRPAQTLPKKVPEKNIKKIEASLEKTAKNTLKKGADTTATELLTFDEVDAMCNAHLTTAQKQIFVWHMKKINQPLGGGWVKYALTDEEVEAKIAGWEKSKFLIWDGTELVPKWLFFSGNLSQKEDKLNAEYQKQKDFYQNLKNEGKLTETGEVELELLQERYGTANLLISEALQNKKEQWLSLKDPDKKLEIKPTSSFAQNTKVNLKFRTGVPLQLAFVTWLKRESAQDSVEKIEKDLTGEIIYDYAIRMRQYNKDDYEHAGGYEAFLDTKKRCIREAQRFFEWFLNNKINPESQAYIEELWNRKYNSEILFDTREIPVAFTVAKYYRNEKVEILAEKREAVAESMVMGNRCIAFGVGVGKTWTALFIVAQHLENGWIHRPLLATPLQVYKQFIKEAKGLLPHVPVVQLGNLNAQYLAQLPKAESQADANGNLVTKIRAYDNDGDADVSTKYLPLPENSITFVTYEGLKRMGFDDISVSSQVTERLKYIMSSGTENSEQLTEKQQQKRNSNLAKAAGVTNKGATVGVDSLEVDFFILDEAHNAKKLVVDVPAEVAEKTDTAGKKVKEYRMTAGEQSVLALKTFAITASLQWLYNRKNQPFRANTFLLTATPFTNSPLEVYSLMAMLSLYNLENYNGFDTVKAFFDTYADIETRLIVSASGDIVEKEVFAGWRNLQGLQSLIRGYFNYKYSTDTLIRPNRIVVPSPALVKGENKPTEMNSLLVFNKEQRIQQNVVLEYLTLNPSTNPFFRKVYNPVTKKDEPEGDGIRALRAVDLSLKIGISPTVLRQKLGTLSDAPNDVAHMELIETSPKLKYTTDCISRVKRWHEEKGEPCSGQIVYMSRQVDFFPLIKKYLVEIVGFKPYEVGIITSQMETGETKESVQDKFLGRKFNDQTLEYEVIPDEYRVKVLLGGSAILEGMNLQTHCTCIYNLTLDWNPSDFEQLVGRGWRQGNLYKNIRIVVPMMYDSPDTFIFQKLQEKQDRIGALWNYSYNISKLDLGEIDPAEAKIALITDTKKLGRLAVDLSRFALLDKLNRLERSQESIKENADKSKSIGAALLRVYAQQVLDYVDYYLLGNEKYLQIRNETQKAIKTFDALHLLEKENVNWLLERMETNYILVWTEAKAERTKIKKCFEEFIKKLKLGEEVIDAKQTMANVFFNLFSNEGVDALKAYTQIDEIDIKNTIKGLDKSDLRAFAKTVYPLLVQTFQKELGQNIPISTIKYMYSSEIAEMGESDTMAKFKAQMRAFKQAINGLGVSSENFDTKAILSDLNTQQKDLTQQIEELARPEHLQKIIEELTIKRNAMLANRPDYRQSIKNFELANDTLLSDRKPFFPSCKFGESSVHYQSVGQSIMVRQDEGQNRRAVIKKIMERGTCEPMYWVEYTNGQKGFVFLNEIVNNERFVVRAAAEKRIAEWQKCAASKK